MKKILLVMRAVSLCAFLITVTTEANAQAPAAKGSAPNKEQQLQFRQQVMQRFDTNHDGVISESERTQMRETIRKENQKLSAEGGQPGSAQPGAGNQPKSYHRQLTERFDSNKDGHLDGNELMQMRQAIQAQGGRGGMHGRQMPSH